MADLSRGDTEIFRGSGSIYKKCSIDYLTRLDALAELGELSLTGEPLFSVWELSFQVGQ